MPVPGWTILCDFDGTISVEDVIDSLLDRFGRPGWEVLEQDWRAGRIGSRECMAGQVALLQMTRAELDAHLAGLWIDHAFPGFVAKVRELDMPIRVVSDGLDVAIRRILTRYGLDDLPLSANHLAPAEFRPRALPHRYVEMRRTDPAGIDNRRALADLPPLIKGYLRLGGFVGDGAVVDRQFNTTDVAVLVKTELVTDKYQRHFERDQPDGTQWPGGAPP